MQAAGLLVSVPRRGEAVLRPSLDFISYATEFRRVTQAFRPDLFAQNRVTEKKPQTVGWGCLFDVKKGLKKRGKVVRGRWIAPNTPFPPSCHVLGRFTRRCKRAYNATKTSRTRINRAMLTLQTMLNRRTHRDLELIARAHDLPFTRREAKAVGLAALSVQLHGGALEKAYRGLTSSHIAALHALVAAGDCLPLPLFTAHFGQIRPYKPWRWAARAFLTERYPRHPWRYPVSAAERLYHLGFIHIHDWEVVEIVAEVKALLPSLPRPQATPQAMPPRELNGRALLLRDVAALLGVLGGRDVAPVHGRWLPLSAMRAVNAVLQVPEPGLASGDVRSEKAAGRLRWLHYLAEAAGLLRVQAGVLQPTRAAWDWLSAPPDVQWAALMQAVAGDLGAKTRLWDAFGLPEVSLRTWQRVYYTLEGLSPAAVYRVPSVFETFGPHLLPESRETLARLLGELMVWSGVLMIERGRLLVHRPLGAVSTPDTRAAPLPPILPTEDGYQVRLPSQASPALVTLLMFAPADVHTAVVDETAVRHAVRLGLDTAGILALLSELGALPPCAPEQIKAWVQEAQQFTLQQMTVLHAPDAADIDRVRDDWRLAGYVTQRLSPHHLAVAAGEADALTHRLQRRGYAVTSLLPPSRKQDITKDLNADMAAYLLLAVRTYQKLHSRLEAGPRIPKALTHWLAGHLDDVGALGDIEAQADALTLAVQKQVPSPVPLADDSPQDTVSIYQQLQDAYERGVPVTIDYESPMYGASTRTITIEILYETDDRILIDAFCHLAGDGRTFRLDRVQRVHPPPRQLAG